MKSNSMEMKKGKVWLVGAGPGDEGLLTLKGFEALKKAETVIYDALVGQGILAMIPDDAELIYAGKRANVHTLKQEEINNLLLGKALEGKRVVRLKGGDPFVFGRGGEETELLRQHDIPYEIVPGVTSAFAAPAYAGIPVTHRDYCTSVSVITGHRRRNGDLDIDFEALANTGGTLVFMMGMSTLGIIRERLLAAGMDPYTPAAIIEKGTTASQRVLQSDLEHILRTAETHEAKAPAAIVIGGVAELASEFNWRGALPLAGVRAVVTRPKELSSGLASMLRQRGAEVTELPAICIAPVEDNAELEAAIGRLSGNYYQWVVFTSPSGVRVFFDELMKNGDARSLASCKVAVIGRGTERELRTHGIKADMIPSSYDGETLGRELRALLDEGDRILIPRARLGNKALTDELSKAAGVVIDDIATYDTLYKKAEWFDADAAFEEDNTYALFTSASTVRGFVNAYPGMDLSKVKAVCIGRMTAAAAEEYGMETAVSEAATLESLTAKLEEIRGVSNG